MGQFAQKLDQVIVELRRLNDGRAPAAREILSVELAAEYLGLSEHTIRMYIRQRKIPHFKVSGVIRFRRSRLDQWIDQGEIRMITLTQTKGKRDRALPMTLEVAHLLNTLPRDKDKVFPYSPCWVTHLFKIFRKKAGIGTQYTLHSLRHTCATDLLRSGVSIYTVQKMLGHSSIAVTERYLHALPEDLHEAAEVVSKRIKISA